MVLNKDFREFIKLLNYNDVHYLVVGGYAVAFHGHPRYTKDLDIWILVNQINAKKVLKTLDEFGFSSLGLKYEDFLEPGYVIQLGYPPNRIDILTQVTGLEFDLCYSSKMQLERVKNLMKFQITINRDQDGVWIVESPPIPGCISQGYTRAEALENITKAIRLCLEIRTVIGILI